VAFKPVYVVDGARTPFLKARNAPGPFAASDLAVQAGRSLLTRQPFSPSDLDEVILGCAAPRRMKPISAAWSRCVWAAALMCRAGR
jgi:acetyl-CoA C-acetyltransferase